MPNDEDVNDQIPNPNDQSTGDTDKDSNDPDGTNNPTEVPDYQLPVTDSPSELDELKQKCAEYLDGWRRAQADYQNLTRETGKQRLETVRFANEDLILDLLPIMDNFKMAYNQIPDNEKDSSWVVGFSHIKKQLWDVLAVSGVKEIETVGEKFDPTIHEAIDKRTVEDKADDIILNEVKAGYTLNGKVIQVAKVIINHLEKE